MHKVPRPLDRNFLFFFALSIGISSVMFGQNTKQADTSEETSKLPEVQRDWTEAGEQKRKIHGSLLKINPHNVLIRIPNSNQEKLVKKSQLSKLDLDFLEILPSVHSDGQQYEQTKSIWYAMHQGTFPSTKEVREYQVRFPKSPYGLLLSGIATACTTPDYEIAEGYFEKAYKAISSREKILPDLTPATYVTCCNNYAIVLWRQGQSNLAVRLLRDAASIGPRPPELLIHNAKIIATENRNRVEKFQVSKKTLPVLDELIALAFEKSPERLRDGYMHFSLNVDAPPPVTALDELLRLHSEGQLMVKERFTEDPVFAELMLSKNCPYEPWCTNCGGRGVFRCPNRCNRGVVSVPVASLDARGIRGEPIYGTRFVDKPCPVCDGKGVGGRCDKCLGTGKNNSRD